MTDLERAYMHGDSKHEIVGDVLLAYGAKLHRFVNGSGVDYSAIYQGDFESWSHERNREADMVKAWNDNAVHNGWELIWRAPAHWDDMGDGMCACSECHNAIAGDYGELVETFKFCPVCGAAMKGDVW